jgi:hypothetical protein
LGRIMCADGRSGEHKQAAIGAAKLHSSRETASRGLPECRFAN